MASSACSERRRGSRNDRPTLPELGADQLGHLELHHLRRDGLDRLANHVGVLIEQHLLDDLLDRHPVGTGHRWRLLSVEPSASPTIMSAGVAETSLRAIPSEPLLRMFVKSARRRLAPVQGWRRVWATTS
jgi:hypothetical protein